MRDKRTQEQEDRLFLVAWGVAMWAAAPPINTSETRIPAELATEARALLTELGYDWEAARREHLEKVAAQRQRNVDRRRKEFLANLAKQEGRPAPS